MTCSRQRDAGLPVVLPRRAESAISPPLLPRIPEPRGPLAPRPAPSQHSLLPSAPVPPRPAPLHKPISSRNLPALQLQRSPRSEALLPPEAASLNDFQFPEVVLSASRSDPGAQRWGLSLLDPPLTHSALLHPEVPGPGPNSHGVMNIDTSFSSSHCKSAQ